MRSTTFVSLLSSLLFLFSFGWLFSINRLLYWLIRCFLRCDLRRRLDSDLEFGFSGGCIAFHSHKTFVFFRGPWVGSVAW